MPDLVDASTPTSVDPAELVCHPRVRHEELPPTALGHALQRVLDALDRVPYRGYEKALE